MALYEGPLLVLQARDDEFCIGPGAESLYAAGGGIIKRFVWFERTGHEVYTQPEKYWPEIGQFLAELLTAGIGCSGCGIPDYKSSGEMLTNVDRLSNGGAPGFGTLTRDAS